MNECVYIYKKLKIIISIQCLVPIMSINNQQTKQEFPNESYQSPLPTKREIIIPGAPIANRNCKKYSNNLFFTFPNFDTKYTNIQDSKYIDNETKNSIKNIKSFIESIDNPQDKNDFIQSFQNYINQ